MMRRRILSVALVATLTGLLALATPALAQSRATPALAQSRASRAKLPGAALDAAGWLGRQFHSTGDLPAFEGEAGLNNLSLALVSLEAAGTGRLQVRRGLAYLEKHFGSYISATEGKKSVVLPGRLAEVMLAAEATGASPTHFGGRSPADDLVARLLATQARTGADAGLFGSPDGPTFSTTYTQGLALLALAAARQPNKAGADWLVSQQCTNGGWTTFRSSLKTPCAKENPAEYAGADTNSTSLAIEALVATKVSPRLSPLEFLEHSQYPGGGFGYIGAVSSKQPVDPDSTALVIQALVALHELGSPGFHKAGGTPERALDRFQLGCSMPASERGSFTYPGVPGPNLISTIQAIPAAAHKALPIRPGSLASSLPALSCRAAATRTGDGPGSTRGSSRSAAPPSTTGPVEKTCPSVPKAGKGEVVVPIVVDFGTDADKITVTCVAMKDGSNGADVLQARAALLHTAQPVYASSGLLCSIDGYPTNGCGTSTSGHYAYWAYFHGGSKWTYANDGPAENVVSKGDVEGWRFEPDGSASSADPPPRAPSSAASLEDAPSAPPSTTTTTTSPETTTTASTRVTSTTRVASTSTTAAGPNSGTTAGGNHGTKGAGATSSTEAGSGSSGGSTRAAAAGALANPRGHASSQTGRDILLVVAAALIVGGAAYAVVRSRRALGAE